MEIVDSQFHEPTVREAWSFGHESERVAGVELAREAIDCVGVDAALLNAGVDFCKAAVGRYPDRFGACLFAGRAASAQPAPYVEVDDPDIDHAVSIFRDEPGMLALRVIIRNFADGKLTEDFVGGRNEPVLAAAEKHSVPIFLTAGGHLSSAAEVARAHPELTLIIDHLGLNQPPADIGDQPWAMLDDLVALARFPNVGLKLCGGTTLTSSQYPHPDLWPNYGRIIQAFTADRVMWASDFTRLRTYRRNYADELHFIRDTNELTDADKTKILGGTVRRLLRWPAKDGQAG